MSRTSHIKHRRILTLFTVAAMAASVCTLVLNVSAVPANAAPGNQRSDTSTAEATPTKTLELSCGDATHGADARVQVGALGDPWAGDVTWSIKLSEVRFAKSPGSASIGIAAMVNGKLINYGYDRTNSGTIAQDGQWHKLDVAPVIQRVNLPETSSLGLWADVRLMGIAQPGCHTHKSWNVAKQVGGVQKGGLLDVDWKQALGFCSIGHGGGQCSIASTKVAMSSVSAGISGVYDEWLTGSLSRTWTKSTSVDIRCTSPLLPAGSIYTAYPAGYTYRYDVSVDFFGHDYGVRQGTAFEVVANGLHCETAA